MHNFLLLLLLSITLITSCNNSISDKNAPVAKQGVLDLSNWDFRADGNVNVYGEWEFYWKKLYSPEDFSNNPYLSRTGYINLPGPWDLIKKIGRAHV
mgnify:FL=1